MTHKTTFKVKQIVLSNEGISIDIYDIFFYSKKAIMDVAYFVW